MLLDDVKKTAKFILNDSFWMAQTEQIDITEGRNFEMIPTVGNHIVKLGNGDDIDKKFHRLLLFYQQVMSKTGFDRYNMVDVQYEGQVIGSKTKTSKVDSIQLKKNVEKLLQEAKQMQKDSIAATPITEKENISPDQENTAIDQEQTNSNPLKTATITKPKLIVKKMEEKKPKAIMLEKN
jgi:cell division protein FtsQ